MKKYKFFDKFIHPPEIGGINAIVSPELISTDSFNDKYFRFNAIAIVCSIGWSCGHFIWHKNFRKSYARGHDDCNVNRISPPLFD
ncbi:hypothetical protein DERP_013433 [Dermatophagoides pteronyssinus]|uniref:Uncharacterized protein n=1 Tax=Dermatophagoides pteronyssinus TaxID=6956 RepID=A0ABQ8JS16_DERPT|nr:hypothetical protein DERP_013433 [Dermatophagoides pteronyssinus]